MTETKKTPTQRPPVIMDELVLKQIAAVAISGASYRQIADTLGISRTLVKKACESPKFKELVAKIGDEELAPAIVRAKSRISKLLDKAMIVLEHHLDQNNLEAVKLVFKSIGLDNTETGAGDSTINVILPGASPKGSAPSEKDIDVIEIG